MSVQILDEVARSAEVLATGDADEQQAAIVQQYLNALVCSYPLRAGRSRPRRAEAVTADMLTAHAERVMADVPPVGDLPEVSHRGTPEEHRQVAGWGGVPGECGVECSCGVTYDNFDTIAEAGTLLDQHIADNTEQHPAWCAYAPGCGGTHNTAWVNIPATGRDGEVGDHGVIFPLVSIAAEWEVYADGNDVHDGRPLVHLAVSWPDGTSAALRFTPDEWREASGEIEAMHALAKADPRWATKPVADEFKSVLCGDEWASELHPFWCPEATATGCGVCCAMYEYMPASGGGWKPTDGGVLMPALAVAAEATCGGGVDRRGVSLNFTGVDRSVSLSLDEAVQLCAAGHVALVTLSDFEEGRS